MMHHRIIGSLAAARLHPAGYKRLVAAALVHRWLACHRATLGLSLAFFTCGCSHRAPVPADPASIKSVVVSSTSFALSLYLQLAQGSGNLSFSPYNISTSLAVIYAGAHGETEQEIAKVLHFDVPREDLNKTFTALAARMAQIQHRNGVTLRTGT